MTPTSRNDRASPKRKQLEPNQVFTNASLASRILTSKSKEYSQRQFGHGVQCACQTERSISLFDVTPTNLTLAKTSHQNVKITQQVIRCLTRQSILPLWFSLRRRNKRFSHWHYQRQKNDVKSTSKNTLTLNWWASQYDPHHSLTLSKKLPSTAELVDAVAVTMVKTRSLKRVKDQNGRVLVEPEFGWVAGQQDRSIRLGSLESRAW